VSVVPVPGRDGASLQPHAIAHPQPSDPVDTRLVRVDPARQQHRPFCSSPLLSPQTDVLNPHPHDVLSHTQIETLLSVTVPPSVTPPPRRPLVRRLRPPLPYAGDTLATHLGRMEDPHACTPSVLPTTVPKELHWQFQGKKTFRPRGFGPSGPTLTVRTRTDEQLYEKAVAGAQWGLFWTLQHLLLSADPTQDEALVLDWGANVGFLTILAAKLGFQVMGIEAHPATFQTLQFNLWLNCVTKTVYVANVALAHQEGKALLSNSDLSGANSMSDYARKRNREVFRGFEDFAATEIHTETWDDLLLSLRFVATTPSRHRIDLRRRAYLLKIDIEGSEMNALTGARAYLRALPPRYIAFESNWNNYMDHSQALMRTVRDLGYKLYVIGPVDSGVDEFHPLPFWTDFLQRPVPEDLSAFFSSQTFFMADILGVHQGKPP
jgi:FkbM family methyltransferase